MKVAKFKYVEDINIVVIDDLLLITKYLMLKFDCYMTAIDAYNLWRKISKDRNSDWILFSSLREAQQREFLAQGLSNYCIVKGD